MSKDILAEFPSHLIPKGLYAPAHQEAHKRKCRVCRCEMMNKHCTCNRGRHLGWMTVLLTACARTADRASLLEHVAAEKSSFFHY